MKRWNGWGDESVTYTVPKGAVEFLRTHVGEAQPPADADFTDVVRQVPATRLPEHPLVNTDPADRLRHARGHSLPDWIALRTGRISAFPDGVAYPLTDQDVQHLLRYAQETGAHLIPYGGGTSVVGHINVIADGPPVLTVDMSRMNQLRGLDEYSQLATFGAGVSGPDLEAQLRAHGFTLGHYPQSFEYSTLGGWIASRSSGQQSLHYGRVEDLFAGGTLETPAGSLELPTFPASAAGPDLHELVLGSEGRLGIITEAVVRVSPLPEHEEFRAAFFADFSDGLAAVQAMVQARLPLSMLRLSTAVETETMLTLAGHEGAIQLFERLLATRGIDEGKCMLMFGFTGGLAVGRATIRDALQIIKQHNGAHLMRVGRIFGYQWRKSRFRTPYLRNALWDMGYAVDTLETATSWTQVEPMVGGIEQALRDAAGDEPLHIFTHLSHMYPYGSSVYTTYLFRVGPDMDEHWTAMKRAASEAIVTHGGTISHQHGVGIDHAPYLAAEKGELGLGALRQLCAHFDPTGIMNPGKLVV